MGTSEQWRVKINPWVRLIREAAVHQLPKCQDLRLEDFIFYCCAFVKVIFHLKPPGWAVSPIVELDLIEEPEWNLPQVVTYVKRLEAQRGKEMQSRLPRLS